MSPSSLVSRAIPKYKFVRGLGACFAVGRMTQLSPFILSIQRVDGPWQVCSRTHSLRITEIHWISTSVPQLEYETYLVIQDNGVTRRRRHAMDSRRLLNWEPVNRIVDDNINTLSLNSISLWTDLEDVYTRIRIGDRSLESTKRVLLRRLYATISRTYCDDDDVLGRYVRHRITDHGKGVRAGTFYYVWPFVGGLRSAVVLSGNCVMYASVGQLPMSTIPDSTVQWVQANSSAPLQRLVLNDGTCYTRFVHLVLMRRDVPHLYLYTLRLGVDWTQSSGLFTGQFGLSLSS